MRKTFLLVVAAALVAVGYRIACSMAAKKEIELLSEETIETLVAGFERRFAKLANADCPHEPFGEPLQGEATADIEAAIEGAASGKCGEILEKHAAALAGGTPETVELPANGRPAYEKPEWLDELLAACREPLRRMELAVRHPRGCSPFRVVSGKTPMPMVASRLAGLGRHAAWALAEKGNRHEALELALSQMRFWQDATRGGVPMIVTVVCVNAQRKLAPLAATLLNAETDARELERAGELLALLLKGHVHPSEYLPAEYLNLANEIFLQVLKRKPGAALPRSNELPQGLSERQAAGIALAAIEEILTTMEKSCTPRSLPDDCMETLRALERQLENGAPSVWTILGRKLLSDDSRRESLVLALEQMKKVLAPAFSKYVEKDAELLSMLGMLRLQAHLRLLSVQERSCPDTKSMVLSREIKHLAVDRWTGKPFLLSQSAGSIVLSTAKTGATGGPRLLVACPSASKKGP